MISRKTKILLRIAAGMLAVVCCLGAFWIHRLGKVHQHCIKITGSAFSLYAADHNGVLPFSTNGFGTALLSLVKEGYLPSVAFI
jgi:hypothetical protein